MDIWFVLKLLLTLFALLLAGVIIIQFIRKINNKIHKKSLNNNLLLKDCINIDENMKLVEIYNKNHI